MLDHLKECVCAYYSLYWSSRPAWRRASSSGSSCSPLTQEGTHWLLNLHIWTTQTHMKTITLTCALTELLQGLSRVRNSCRQLTRMEPCLSMPVTQSSSLNYMQKNLHSVNVLYLTVLSLATSYNSALFLTHSSTHLADRLTRKFHSLADTHTHTQLRFHSDTPPSGSSNREGEGTNVSLPIMLQHSPLPLHPPPTPPCSNHS